MRLSHQKILRGLRAAARVTKATGPGPTAMQIPLRVRDVASVLVAAIACAVFLKFFVLDAYRIPSGSMENTLLVDDYVLVNKFIYGATTPRYIPFSAVSLPFITLPRLARPAAGDVVVFELPSYGDQPDRSETVNYIKRCVAVPGDTLWIKDGVVRVNGKVVQFPGEVTADGPVADPGRNFGPVVVPGRGQVIRLMRTNIPQWLNVFNAEGHRVGVRPDGGVMIDSKLQDTYRIEKDYYFVLGDHRAASVDSRILGFVPADQIIGKVMMIYWSWNASGARSLTERLSAIRWQRIGRIVR